MTTFIRLTSGQEIDGEITVNAEFKELNPVARLDLLGDWLGVLQELYNHQWHAIYGGDYAPHEGCLSAVKYQKQP
jgi:hypothetical protein